MAPWSQYRCEDWRREALGNSPTDTVRSWCTQELDSSQLASQSGKSSQLPRAFNCGIIPSLLKKKRKERGRTGRRRTHFEHSEPHAPHSEDTWNDWNSEGNMSKRQSTPLGITLFWFESFVFSLQELCRSWGRISSHTLSVCSDWLCPYAPL